MPNSYPNETAGQLAFYKEFQPYLPALPEILIASTDGVVKGNLLEFKLAINDTPAVLFQAVKYLSKLRLTGRNVPRNILLIDLNAKVLRVYDALDYRDAIHQTYAISASRENAGFHVVREPEVVHDFLVGGAARVVELLKSDEFVPVDITQECVVPWAERYYREVPGSTKEHLLAANGELRKPARFAGLVTPYHGDDWSEFKRILDRLNDKLKKIELGAFYTPEPYVKKSYELLLTAIGRVPAGNDYVLIDRCAGTGNLQRGLDAIPCPHPDCPGAAASGAEDGEPHTVLSHAIVNTYEKFEYLELLREFAGRVRAVIPPTVAAGEDSGFGTLLNGDALSDRFVLGAPVKKDGDDTADHRAPNATRAYLDDPHCTIILFENPPYADVAGVEANVSGKKESFGWQSSWVKKQMAADPDIKANGTQPLRDLTNLFIWSAFRYYLRLPTDSYVVYSPSKYFKSQGLAQKEFVDGYLFNRRRFHATKDAGVSCVLWGNTDDTTRTEFPLKMYDVDEGDKYDHGDDAIVPGALHKGFDPDSGNISTGSDGVPVVTVHKTSSVFSALFDTRKFPDDTTGIYCETNGREAHRKAITAAVYNPNIVGYLRAYGTSFENIDLYSQLTRCTAYNGNGFHLRSDNFATKLPLFVAGRMASEGRFWIRGVVNRCADNGDNFSHDLGFLKECLLYTALAYHNKCLSFTGSDKREYRNELCLDGDTAARRELDRLAKSHPLTTQEDGLLAQWEAVLAEARKVTKVRRHGADKKVFDPSIPWGLYQIALELNTTHPVTSAKGKVTQIADSPDLNGAINTMKGLLAAYHAKVITPRLWEFGLVK
ncbi:hypothetical protein PCC79_07455 [Propioniciclava soli]|uniref:DNA methylase adenine-specific domain-containing protein n=1 Tax=Propioniciclava soli TaxID=2775081 RepID=A0ABZ3CBM9_9ACTN